MSSIRDTLLTELYIAFNQVDDDDLADVLTYTLKLSDSELDSDEFYDLLDRSKQKGKLLFTKEELAYFASKGIHIKESNLSQYFNNTQQSLWTIPMIRGSVVNGKDPIPHGCLNNVLDLNRVRIRQGHHLFTHGIDYMFTIYNVEWIINGTQPTPGSSYEIYYT